MKSGVPLLMLLLGAAAPSAQDNRVVSFESYEGIQSSVRTIVSEHGYTGVDDKILCRAGDLAAVVIVKTIPDNELGSTPTTKDVLMILRLAFGCPARCVAESRNQHPQVTMRLLEHLRTRASGPMQSEIDQTRDFVIQQTKDIE